MYIRDSTVAEGLSRSIENSCSMGTVVETERLYNSSEILALMTDRRRLTVEAYIGTSLTSSWVRVSLESRISSE
jgi:hypothetical protein